MLNSQPGESGNMPENGNAFSSHATASLVSRTFLLRIYMLCAWARDGNVSTAQLGSNSDALTVRQLSALSTKAWKN